MTAPSLILTAPTATPATAPTAVALPSRLGEISFQCRAFLLALRRAVVDIATGVRRLPAGNPAAFPFRVAESRTGLWVDTRLSEAAMQRGKVENLDLRAAQALDGTRLDAGELFSFWKQIGRLTRGRGYVAGRELREGCLIPSVGGGICQLSNALYSAALDSGLEIVERHAHSQVIPGSAAERDRDATVKWNYIDLRFRSDRPLLLRASLTRNELVISFWGGESPTVAPALRKTADVSPPERPTFNVLEHSCGSCSADGCFRHVKKPNPVLDEGRTAFLVDENWSELQRYVRETRTAQDALGVPLDGARWRQPRYRWNTEGFARVGEASWPAVKRALAARRASRGGAVRIEGQLRHAAEIARSLARLLRPDDTHVCCAQSLLPYLWKAGHLGGRKVTVLMTRLPLHILQARLDEAHRQHPERGTLGEYRAPAWLVQTEREALAAADRIVTPHPEVAALYPGKAVLLDWAAPSPRPWVPGAAILFAGPTAARKGAWELREAARALDLEVVLVGSELEGSDFWSGVRTRRVAPGADPFAGVAAVAQPALVEERPRLLLEALARGIPVIATKACGLDGRPGVATVPYGDVPALIDALKAAGDRRA